MADNYTGGRERICRRCGEPIEGRILLHGKYPFDVDCYNHVVGGNVRDREHGEVMPVYLWARDWKSGRAITYGASNYVSQKSVNLDAKDVIGFAVREKGETIKVVSDDLTEFMDAVDEQAIAVRWFDESIRSELERNGGYSDKGR